MQPDLTLTVDGARPGPRLSPILHGIFFEEINHAGDGGLYPEKLRNRDFSEGTAHWEAFGGAKATTEGNALTLTGPGGVRTEGYWGIGLERGKKLVLSLEATNPIAATLVSPQGKVLAQATLKAGKGQVGLTPGASCPDARLELRPVAFPVVLKNPSLMPTETRGQAKLRKDLATLVAAMKPSFVRFPGGCYVEGDRIGDRFIWKGTLGDPNQRGGTRCIWGYKGTNGLGFHEYLLWCDDLKAEPLFVINCGMSHKDVTPLSQMDAVIQDALDALEYANGDPNTTKWGAERAKNGHPKPFGLKLIEIGNENGGPRYNERYKLLFDAIKKKHPYVRTIANDWGGLPTSAPIEIVDEHYYNTPQFFFEQANRYDSYDRKKHKVYVGEYAVTQGCGQGNLIAALGEAAFITGMERNSDVVVMASYAPLFVNANNRAWNPDAIVFNSSEAFGTPSYWVQQLFSTNRGDVVLPTKLVSSPKSGDQGATAEARGGVGVGTWRTDAEYKEVAVDGKPVTLTPGQGSWQKTAEGGLRQTNAQGDDFRATGGDPNASNYTLTLKAKKNGGDEGFLIMFYSRSAGDFLWWNLGGWGNTRHEIERAVSGGKSSLLRPQVQGKIETGRWYDIKIECLGPRIKCYLDGKLLHDITLPPPPSAIHAVTTRDEKTGDILVKLVNGGKSAHTTTINLQNVGKLTGKGTATVLTHTDPQAENSFAQPTRIAPVTKPLTGVAPSFTYDAPAYSVSILRLKTR
ncbi:alpha-L-arabinofuranosidase C-terminal domain-containing protein [Armatimonas rosea]|uniref:non-reducing end alpha-L-arabinofuranosidase n=1 Tax=Armatimonas rosea TaxID=685828 RepID=A0A7W9SLE1_ARMRO|nr:alpha-L-arabinofuranosidase C-terminal domain-containing protein [Armatimonas rosea]MBB6048770.1 alpha-L-arabinofuranosidase [Armatimonas rosea]